MYSHLELKQDRNMQPHIVATQENSRTYCDINLVVDRIEETSHRLQSGHHSKDSTSVSSKQEDLFLTK